MGLFKGRLGFGGSDDACCAVLLENLPASAPKFVVTRGSKPIEIPAEQFHAECTRHLGAQHGERRAFIGFRDDRAAWSAHLRFLVNRSAESDRARDPSVRLPLDEDFLADA
jgi:hypothetical protein